MAVITRRRIEPVRTISGNSPRTLVLPLGATQTFKTGECVQLVAGYVQVCGSANPTAILGFAAEDATSGTAGQYNIKVWLADRDTIFVGNVGSGSTQTTSVALRGAGAGLYDVGDYWTVDTSITATTQRVQIVDLDTRDTVGDTYGRVHFTVKQPYFQLASTSGI